MAKKEITWTAKDEQDAIRSVRTIMAFRHAGRLFTTRRHRDKIPMDILRERLAEAINAYYADSTIRNVLTDRFGAIDPPQPQNMNFYQALEETRQIIGLTDSFVHREFVLPDFKARNKSYKKVVKICDIAEIFAAALRKQKFSHGYKAARNEDNLYRILTGPRIR